MHKQPSALRFIAASSVGTSIRPVSLWLSLALKEVMRNCDALWSTSLKQAGVPCSRSWMIKDSTYFIDLVRGVRRKMAAPLPAAFVQTFDFKTLYTKIPLADLKSRVGALFELGFDAQAVHNLNFIALSRGDAEWKTTKQGLVPRLVRITRLLTKLTSSHISDC
jgi:hypothetical protein